METFLGLGNRANYLAGAEATQQCLGDGLPLVHFPVCLSDAFMVISF